MKLPFNILIIIIKAITGGLKSLSIAVEAKHLEDVMAAKYPTLTHIPATKIHNCLLRMEQDGIKLHDLSEHERVQKVVEYNSL